MNSPCLISGHVVLSKIPGDYIIDQDDILTASLSDRIWVDGKEFLTPVSFRDILNGTAQPVAPVPVTSPNKPDANPFGDAQTKNVELPQHNPEKDDVMTDNETEQCSICMERKKQCVYVPCGHFNTCLSCTHQIYNQNGKTLVCSICKASVTLVQKVF